MSRHRVSTPFPRVLKVLIKFPFTDLFIRLCFIRNSVSCSSALSDLSLGHWTCLFNRLWLGKATVGLVSPTGLLSISVVCRKLDLRYFMSKFLAKKNPLSVTSNPFSPSGDLFISTLWGEKNIHWKRHASGWGQVSTASSERRQEYSRLWKTFVVPIEDVSRDWWFCFSLRCLW